MIARASIAQFATFTVLLASILAATSEAHAAPAKKCVPFAGWSARADAIKERVYINPSSSGRTLLEYTTSADDEVYVFYTTATVVKGDYRLSASIKTGNSPADFEVSLGGAIDAATGQEIKLTIQEGKTFQLKRTIRVGDGSVTLRIRSKPPGPAKVWSFVSNPTLCPI
jgi:hypothetical protein